MNTACKTLVSAAVLLLLSACATTDDSASFVPRRTRWGARERYSRCSPAGGRASSGSAATDHSSRRFSGGFTQMTRTRTGAWFAASSTAAT